MGVWGGGHGAGGWSTNLAGVAGPGGRHAAHWGSSMGGDWEQEYGSLYQPQLARRLFQYIKPHKRWASVALVAMIVFAVSSFIQPFLIAKAIQGAIEDRDLGDLRGWMIALAASAVIAWAAEFLRQWAMARVGHRILLQLRNEMFAHLLSLSQRFYDEAEVGRVMSRITSDVQVLQELITAGVLTVVSDIVGLGIVISMLMILDLQLALVTFAVLPVLVIAMVLWARRARVAFLDVRQAISVVNGTLNEDLNGVRVVQGLGREDENARRFDKVNQWNLRATKRAGRLSASVIPLVEVLIAVASGLVIVVVGIRLANGSLEPAVGVAVALGFVLYIQRFFDPIRDLVLQFTMFQRAMAGAERIFEVLDTAPDIVDKPSAIALEDIRGEVEFRDVSLEYVDGVRVLHHIDLRVEAGETVALVGATGAGKTSITQLIGRNYDATEGAVLIDGQDVRDLQRSSLTRRMGVVLQDPFLFSESVLENIRYGRLDATREEVEAAAQVVGAHDWITRLPDGYDSVLTERGQNLSVGQRQLIAFARAILADPRILILDEATANVDSRTEALIQTAIARILKGRTAFVIAHRLSTIRSVDRVIVVQDGRIVEMGRHDDLLAQNGLYAELYRMAYEEHDAETFDESDALAVLNRLRQRERPRPEPDTQPDGAGALAQPAG